MPLREGGWRGVTARGRGSFSSLLTPATCCPSPAAACGCDVSAKSFNFAAFGALLFFFVFSGSRKAAKRPKEKVKVAREWTTKLGKGFAWVLYVNSTPSTARLVKLANQLGWGGGECKLTNCKLVGKFGKLVLPRFCNLHTLCSGSEMISFSELLSTFQKGGYLQTSYYDL